VLYRDRLQGIDCIDMMSGPLNLNILNPAVLNLDSLTVKKTEIF